MQFKMLHKKLCIKINYKTIKLKNIFREYKLISFLLVFIILIGFIKISNVSPVLYLKNFLNNSKNSSYNSFFTTIIGAFVGGFFTLIGSYIATKNDIRLKADIRKSRIIFAPIFDEIVQNIERLEEQPYPFYELITQRSLPTHIYYNAWDRINNDFRKLEVSKPLKYYMQLLYSSITDYKKALYDFMENAHCELGEICARYGLIDNNHIETSNFIEMIIGDLIINENSNYFKEYSYPEDTNLDHLHDELHKKLIEIKGYNQLLLNQKKWKQIQLFGEKYLGELIRNVNLRQVK